MLQNQTKSIKRIDMNALNALVPVWNSNLINEEPVLILNGWPLRKNSGGLRDWGMNPLSSKEQCPPLHLSVEAVEKEAFGLPSTTVANFTYLMGPIVTLLFFAENAF